MSTTLLTLGGLRLAGSEFARTKPLLLLTYLALEGSRDRQHLAELFWPSSQDPSNSLTAALKQLKQGAPGVIETDRQRLGCLIACDASAFLTAWESERDDAALALYRGPFLDGVYLPGWSTDLEEWVRLTRERLERHLGNVLVRLAEGAMARAEFDRAEGHLLRAMQLDPLAEETLQAYLRLCLQRGHRHQGLHAYQAFAQTLRQELELTPLDTTTMLAQKLRDVTSVTTEPRPLQRALLEPRRADESWSSGDPPAAHATAFIGRTRELGEIVQLLDDPECRLLTLLGPGGIGKTRLALQLAAQQEARFPDGVKVVMLASVQSPDLLAVSISEALGISLHGAASSQHELLRHLQKRSMLLVLDNFEHLLVATPLLTELLNAAPTVRLLVTSREQLGVPGEWHFEVEGLSYPTKEQEDIEHYEAVQLFVRCARRNDSHFTLTATDKAYLVRLCQLTQGMPLALELAAGWLPLLSLQEIAEELERNVDLLAAPARGLGERHHSLRAVFESSYQHLDAEEQTLLMRLSVFRGGFSREAAEAVAQASLSGLLRLHQQSLLKPLGAARYALHELIRQYAYHKFSAAPNEQKAILKAHQQYYLTLLGAREAALAGMGQRGAAEQISKDLDNIRAAWEQAVKTGDVLAAGAAAPALGLYLHAQGLIHEAEARFAKAILRFEELPSLPDEALGELLAQHGLALRKLERHAAAVSRLRQSLERLRRTDALGHVASVLGQLGEAMWHLEGALASEPYLRESLKLARAAGERAATAEALRCLGYLAKERLESAAAERYFRASLAIARQIDRPLSLLQTLYFLAEHVYVQGDYQRAERYRMEALTLSRTLGHRPLETRCLLELSYTLLASGQLEQAEIHLNTSLRFGRELNDQTVIAECLRNLGLIYLEREALTTAQRLLEEALTAARGEVQPWALANALRDTGYLIYLQGEHKLAREHIEASLTIFRRLNETHSVSDALVYLGRVTYEVSPQQAARHYHEALLLALKGRYQSLLADILLATAEWLGGRGEAAQALALLELLQEHPATRHASKNRAQSLVSQFKPHGRLPVTPPNSLTDLSDAAQPALQALERHL